MVNGGLGSKPVKTAPKRIAQSGIGISNRRRLICDKVNSISWRKLKMSGPASSKISPAIFFLVLVKLSPAKIAAATSPTYTGCINILPPFGSGSAGASIAILANRLKKLSPAPKKPTRKPKRSQSITSNLTTKIWRRWVYKKRMSSPR